MDDAGSGGHPLHVPCPEHAAVAGRVLVLELACQRIRHGFEAAMRMVRCAHRLSRTVVDRSHLIDEQEGVHHVHLSARQRATDDEAGSLELPVGGDDLARFTVHRHFDDTRVILIRCHAAPMKKLLSALLLGLGCSSSANQRALTLLSSAERSHPARSAAASYVLRRKASTDSSGRAAVRTASYGRRNSRMTVS